MSKYKEFIFKDYEFDATSGELRLYYGYDDQLEFCEKYTFNFDFVNYDSQALERAIELLFFIAGVSYYKMYMAPTIKINKGAVDQQLSELLRNTYQKGLGEFLFLNHLDPLTTVDFPVNSGPFQALDDNHNSGKIIGLGGGKDSLVSVEILRNQPKVATWSLNHRAQLQPLVDTIGLTHFWVDREWDEQIRELNQKDAMNGHVPISAIFACVGTVVTILAGYQDSVVSNESSASDPTLYYRGVAINHQYSKSLSFEQDFQAYLKHTYKGSLRYYSLLRPYSELHIAEIFSQIGFEKYKDVFSSCNRAFTHGQDHLFWCGECAKCAFVFLILTPFLGGHKVEKLWNGRNLLLDPAHEITYRQLLGIEGDKPLDCVGEVKESRSAMKLAQDEYPELKTRYIFDIPDDYNWRAISESSMPSEIYKLLEEGLKDLN